jgi:tRNA (mo5U34)-methyltransferase
MTVNEAADRPLVKAEIERRVAELGPWFHDLDWAACAPRPTTSCGIIPRTSSSASPRHLPDDLTGKSVLDIGCNAGFYSLEMKRRGAARVLGIDHDERYLEQARFAASVLGYDDIEFRRLEVWDVARSASASTSSSSWACSTTCGTRCSRST